MSATLDGTVGLMSSNPTNVVVRFFTPNTQTEVMKACSPTDTNGDFTIYGITPGTYDVAVKTDSSLSILKEDEGFTEGNTTEIDFGTLVEGDLNDNDWVDMDDYLTLVANHDKVGDCYGYAGDWKLPECPSPPPAEGKCYGYVIS